MTAQRNDPEYAALVLSLPEPPAGQWRPPAAEWSLDTSLLAEIRDRLGLVASLVGDLPAGVKKRGKPPAPFPRPFTAIERARADADAQLDAELDDLVAAAHATYQAEQLEAG